MADPNQRDTPKSLQQLLEYTAKTAPTAGLLVYPKRETSKPWRLSYASLYDEARRLSTTIQHLDGFVEKVPVLLHLNDHLSSIIWFWAVLFANGLAVMSSLFSNSEGHRLKHIRGLCDLLESPLCITKAESVHLFGGCHSLQLHTIEALTDGARCLKADARTMCRSSGHGSDYDPAMLMLTSGSTGNSKAVQLSHKQVLAAVRGKTAVRQLPSDRPFMNWIGLDHVAGLIEIHLQAIFAAVDQVHVHAEDVVSSPRLFLDLISRHRVSRSFAPNFFLARLVSAISPAEVKADEWDLSSLVILGSGGEANDTGTCVALTNLLAKYGSPDNVIMPGFGMTETCAGAIYNLDWPASDLNSGRSTVSVGRCMDGVEMRVTVSSGRLASPGDTGNLEVRGDVIFQSYYHNVSATAEALTSDGWFRTGDKGFMDSQGNLNLVGRERDVFNINGIKIGCELVKNSLETALVNRVRHVVAFPSLSNQSHTEQVVVAFVPEGQDTDVDSLNSIRDSINQVCLVITGSTPFVFLLADASLLPISTLGKISTAKMRALLEAGVFATSIERSKQAFGNRNEQARDPVSETEVWLLEQVAHVLGIDSAAIGVDSHVFDLGVTSMNLIQLKHVIECHLGVQVPIIVIMTNPTVKSLANALDQLGCCPIPLASPSQSLVAYNPVVILHADGNKTPLWLIHPGVGEVLVFIGLVQHMADDDRPVYALRARGFEPGQQRFESISEAVQIYQDAILKHQPEGPYAIAGYSYGSMLAFEVAKRLESHHVSVRFVGCFNLPPHIKTRMRELKWNSCLMHLVYFLNLVQESEAESLEDSLRAASRADAMTRVLKSVDRDRMKALGLEERDLGNWTEVAYGLQSMATDYEPNGRVSGMDVFYAVPLKAVAAGIDDWLSSHLGRWREFCSSRPVFHHVGGAHYTMIGPDHVKSFSQTLKLAMAGRGL